MVSGKDKSCFRKKKKRKLRKLLEQVVHNLPASLRGIDEIERKRVAPEQGAREDESSQ